MNECAIGRQRTGFDDVDSWPAFQQPCHRPKVGFIILVNNDGGDDSTPVSSMPVCEYHGTVLEQAGIEFGIRDTRA